MESYHDKWYFPTETLLSVESHLDFVEDHNLMIPVRN